MPSTTVLRMVWICAALSRKGLLHGIFLGDIAEHQHGTDDLPARSRIDAQLSAMACSLPSRAISTVWSTEPCMVPCARVP